MPMTSGTYKYVSASQQTDRYSIYDNEDQLWNVLQEGSRLLEQDKGIVLKRNLLRWPGQTSLRRSRGRNGGEMKGDSDGN